MIIYRRAPGLFTYQMTDPWGRTHDIYATQLLEWAVVESEIGVFSTYDNGYTKDKVQIYVEKLNGIAVRRFRAEPPFDYCGSTVYRQNFGAKWGKDSWIVPSKWSKFVDGHGNPLVFS